MIIKENCLFISIICFFKTVDNYQSFSFLSCSQVKRFLKWRVYSWTAMKISTNEKHLDCCSIHYCPRNLVFLEGVSKTKQNGLLWRNLVVTLSSTVDVGGIRTTFPTNRSVWTFVKMTFLLLQRVRLFLLETNVYYDTQWMHSICF